MLKLSNNSHYLHLHAPAQPLILPREAQVSSLFKQEVAGQNKESKQWDGHLPVILSVTLTGGKRENRNVINSSGRTLKTWQKPNENWKKETPRLVKQERYRFKFSWVKSLKLKEANLAGRQSCLKWISLYGRHKKSMWLTGRTEGLDHQIQITMSSFEFGTRTDQSPRSNFEFHSSTCAIYCSSCHQAQSKATFVGVLADTCKGFGDPFFLPLPGLVVLLGGPLVILR